MNTQKTASWFNIFYFAIYHFVFFVLTPLYFIFYTWSTPAFLLAILLYAVSMFSVTGGYHRFFSHRTYQAASAIEIVYLLLGCFSMTGSAARWSQDHRLHHAKTDTLEDPYSIKRGFWFAHMGWLLIAYESPVDPTKIPDLWASRWVRLQDKYYLWGALFMNFGAFILCGLLTDWMSSFYLCVLARMFFIHHSVFSINSLAHTWGSKTYAKELTAVDNFFLAFLTFGEGYHNYHHAFPNDYRNGISWYHFDPTKWLIWILEKLHLAKNLRSKDGLIIRANLIQKDLSMVLETLRAKLPDMHTREKIADGLNT